jgi:hypothetical protein
VLAFCFSTSASGTGSSVDTTATCGLNTHRPRYVSWLTTTDLNALLDRQAKYCMYRRFTSEVTLHSQQAPVM